MLRIYDVEEARKTILNREAPSGDNLPVELQQGLDSLFGQGTTPAQAVAQILESVRRGGDGALRSWTKLLDRMELAELRIPRQQLAAASEGLSRNLSQALAFAAERVREFHRRQPMPDWQTNEMGGTLGQRMTPIERVGVYVPGGTAPLPSSLLMSVIPAQVAGVGLIVVCTPPKAHPAIVAAASLCGIEHVYQIGGAQAIAAMAFGTDSVPKVDKIVGAGNLFVTLAKQQLYGVVGLDGLAGPTETMIIADSRANAEWVAADLLAQAEHDVLASAILVTTDRLLAEAVQVAVGRQLEGLSRAAIIERSLATRGGIVMTGNLEEAAILADAYAPEHLCLAVADPQALAKRLKHAGGLFIGESSFEVLGDYVAGPSHIMPTGGTARFASPLNVLDFVKITSLVTLDVETSRRLSEVAVELARAESLTAHAAAASERLGNSQ
jgi:histidinol dehydrogenase